MKAEALRALTIFRQCRSGDSGPADRCNCHVEVAVSGRAAAICVVEKVNCSYMVSGNEGSQNVERLRLTCRV